MKRIKVAIAAMSLGAVLVAGLPSIASAAGVEVDAVSSGEGGEGFVIVEAEAPVRGLGSRAVKIITCKGSYDHPHPGVSSGRTAINAHLTVKCAGGDANKTKVTVSSRMTDGKRSGKVSSSSGNRGYARVGGDLVCVKQKRAYRAIGTARITFPKGYTKVVQKSGAKSKKKSFKQQSNRNCARV